MEKKNKSFVEDNLTESKTPESYYLKGREEIQKFEIKIEEDKYNFNKPRRVTIKARIANDWSSKITKRKSFARWYL